MTADNNNEANSFMVCRGIMGLGVHMHPCGANALQCLLNTMSQELADDSTMGISRQAAANVP